MDIEQVTNRSAIPVLKSIIFILGKSNFSHIKNYYIGYKILKISKLQSTMYLIIKISVGGYIDLDITYRYRYIDIHTEKQGSFPCWN